MECACGCGQPVRDHRYRTVRFLKNHDKRSPIPEPRLCACGCGGQTTIRKGHALTYISGHNRRGLPRPDRGDGRMLNRYGYVLVYAPRHPWVRPGMKGYVLEHRLVVETQLGRALGRTEHVHHINGIKTDNRPENLEVVDRVAHGAKHGRPKGRPVSDEHRSKLSESGKRAWIARRASRA